MKFIIVTGSAGLIGMQACLFFLQKGFNVIGIDNDSRRKFFGAEASINKNKRKLLESKNYQHFSFDILNKKKIEELFSKYKVKIKCVIHCAAQPSHDWATKHILTDYKINSLSTINLLNIYKENCPEACFINLSTNKVYGDNPNKFDFIEKKYRFELSSKNKYFLHGFNESMSIDNCIHSFFGASKLSADLYVQEFGRYFGLNTVTFRGGCLTGENHTGTELHGFLSYLVKTIINKGTYKIFGYKGKQVRDNIHSRDIVNCFWHFYSKPKCGEIYNIGGGRENSCSILEVINFFKKFYKINTTVSYIKENRIGDHKWWISDCRKFKNDYPEWKLEFSLEKILTKIAEFEFMSKDQI